MTVTESAGASLKELVLISSPRSGTNFFCECLSELDGAAAYFEIFNPRGVFGMSDPWVLSAMGRKIGHPVTDSRTPELIDYFSTQKTDALQTMRDELVQTGARMLSYKIFPKQADPDEMRAILGRENVVAGFITRRRLDVYISYVKARNADVWKNKDTRDILPEINVTAFMKWAKQIDAWYADNLALVQELGLPFHIFNYENDIHIGKDALVPALNAQLNTLGVATDWKDAPLRRRFRKQDANVGPFKRIADGEAVRAELRARGKYNYAMSSPLSDAYDVQQAKT